MVAAIHLRIERAGWSETRTLQTTIRWGNGQAERIRAHAAEIVKMNPDLILTLGETGLTAVLNDTRSISILFALANPIALGLIANMAHPGGNATGFMLYEPDFATKWLQLLKAFVPAMRRLLVLSPGNPGSARYLNALESVVSVLAVEMTSTTIGDEHVIDRAIERAARDPQSAMIVLPGSLTNFYKDLIIGLAAQHQLPAVYGGRQFANAGGLVAYDVDRTELYRLVAGYVDRIFKGDKPGDLQCRRRPDTSWLSTLRPLKHLALTCRHNCLPLPTS
jgi:putative ABC transport system substrate-binding protein